MDSYAGLTVLRKHPVYLLLDVSESMQRRDGLGRSSLDVFRPMVDDLLFALADVPGVNTGVWISVLAFSDRVQVLREMTPLTPPRPLRQPTLGLETNYTGMLRHLADNFAADNARIRAAAERIGCQASIQHPLVFVITDGAPFVDGRHEPGSAWQQERNRVVDGAMQAWIAALSVRTEHEDVLWELATGTDAGERNAFLAEPGAPATELASSIRQCITASVSKSVRAGERLIRTPYGMRRASRHGRG